MRLMDNLLQNRLLKSLSEGDLAHLASFMEEVDLPAGKTLERDLEPIQDVFFPASGVCSTVARNTAGREMEVGLFGKEGMSGTAVVLQGTQTPQRTYVQISGFGSKIVVSSLLEVMANRPTIYRRFLLYILAMQTQTAQTAVSNGYGKLEERLARWLLMCDDRIGGRHIEITHQFLSVMLGVRRSGVTVALHVLEGKGLIQANHMSIKVVDRVGLRLAADGSYGAAEDEYERLMAS